MNLGFLNIVRLGRGSGRAAVIDDLDALIAADSLANGFFTSAGADEFVAAALPYFGSVGVQDFAQGGMHLNKTNALIDNPSEVLYLWDDELGAPGPRYEVLINATNVDKAAANGCFFYIGSNDANSATEAAGAPLVEDYKANLKALFGYMMQDFVNLQWIALGIIHRYDVSNVAGASYNRIRKAQLEVISEVSYVLRAPDIYDLDLVDDLHPTTAERQTRFPERLARAAALYSGKAVTGSVLGPRLVSARWMVDRIRAVVEHDGGDYLTIDDDAWLAHRAEIDGVPTAMSGAVMADGETIEFIMPEGQGLITAPTDLFIVYGQAGELSRTNAEVIADNSDQALPLQMGIVSVAADDNPVSRLSGLHTFIHARGSAKTYANGAAVDALAGLGAAGALSDSGRQPDYDADGFDGAGSLVCPDGSSHIKSSAAFSAAAGVTLVGVCEVPAVPGGDVTLMSLSDNSYNGNSRAKLIVTSGGLLRWGDQEDDSFIDINAEIDYRGQRLFYVITLNADGTAARLCVNDVTFTDFNPHDAYLTMTRFIAMAQRTSWASQSGTEIGLIALSERYYDAENDPSLFEIAHYLNTTFNIGADLPNAPGSDFSSGFSDDFN